MINKPENDQDKLLDAALGDESWAGLSAGVKAAALSELGATRRRKRTREACLQAAACLFLTAGITASLWRHSLFITHNVATESPFAKVEHRKSPSAAISHGAPAGVERMESKVGYITEEQMLAMFPKGSCVIAEIEGRRQLVFLDKKIEAEGAAYGG